MKFVVEIDDKTKTLKLRDKILRRNQNYQNQTKLLPMAILFVSIIQHSISAYHKVNIEVWSWQKLWQCLEKKIVQFLGFKSNFFSFGTLMTKIIF